MVSGLRGMAGGSGWPDGGGGRDNGGAEAAPCAVGAGRRWSLGGQGWWRGRDWRGYEGLCNISDV